MKSMRPGSSWQSTVSGASPKLAGAMEVAIAGAAEVGRVGRRIFQKIWDPEPINDRSLNDPVWCLGCSYSLDTKTYGQPRSTTSTPPADHPAETKEFISPPTSGPTSLPVPEIPPDSTTSSFESSLAYEEPGQDGGWPQAFLDDFESRIWMTYRTGFEMIPRSDDPKATLALSLAMRLKTSFGEQMGGFSSDTGWGCMIRSGQSLLANALLIARLGRGRFSWELFAVKHDELTIVNKTGGGLQTLVRKARYCRYLRMTHALHIPSTISSDMAPLHAENILESGLVLQQLRDAYSTLPRVYEVINNLLWQGASE